VEICSEVDPEPETAGGVKVARAPAEQAIL
jgi:hypothetical protein